MVGTICIGTEVRSGVDSPSATSGEADDRRWQARCLGVDIGSLFTGLAQRFMDEPGERLGFLGAFAATLMGLEERLRRTGWGVGQPDMDEEADQHESDQQELVKPRVGCHCGTPFSP
jgi:hypothetical protein